MNIKNWFHKDFTIQTHQELGSTSSRLLELVRSGLANHNQVLVAKTQTAGRGRYGRDWQSDLGNLYFSLLLRADNYNKLSPLLSFIAAVALVQALEQYAEYIRAAQKDEERQNSQQKSFIERKTPVNQLLQRSFRSSSFEQHSVSQYIRAAQKDEERQNSQQKPDLQGSFSCKWPNDILLNGKKIAGILLEGDFANGASDFVVIGVGVNLLSNPTLTTHPASNIKAELAIELDSEELLKGFLDKFSALYDNWLNFGFKAVRNAWLAKAHNINQQILVRLSNQEFQGKFKDLDQEGNLVLELADGSTKLISSGEVFI